MYVYVYTFVPFRMPWGEQGAGRAASPTCAAARGFLSVVMKGSPSTVRISLYRKEFLLQ